jgi:cobalt-precorrin 5A hydrolase/precorrin-3B C17-methyltransferase
MSPAIVILTASALPLAQKLKRHLGGRIHAPEDVRGADVTYAKARPEIARLFSEGQAIVGLCASGILIRAVAPYLANKFREPPVVAVAEDGSAAVPLIGGHHGANALARNIVAAIGGTAAITTASDLKLGEAFDEPGPGYVLGNPDDAKLAASAALRSESIERVETVSRESGSSTKLVYHPQVLVVGVGCERGTDPEELIDLVGGTMADHGLAAESIAHFASIDLKEDEAAVTALGNVRFFSTKELNAESRRVLKPSEIVRAEVGTPSVAEAAALAGAGPDGELIVAKTKSRRATVAIARAPSPVLIPRGRGRGTVHVVGLGPGAPATRSPDATRILQLADDWVGYGLYLDLAMDAHDGQPRHDFPLGGEEDRCRHAIALARQGKQVALVCSGDAGIYAMAALVYELIDLEPCRIAVNVVPGISAFQMAAARAGAFIGHDFCCISLSDLLTPWETIETRIEAAAAGDFVIAFYNPRSLKRQNQLGRAIEILRDHRPETTPVVIAANLGRPEESVAIVALADFDPSTAGMLTVVLVGSSQSKTFRRGDGRTYAYTPRGYAKKRET